MSLDPILAGLRVLLVEDEFLVAVLLMDALEDAGATVLGPAATLAQAEQMAREADYDVAVLDWNLDGEQSDPVARIVVNRARPCVVSTGYGAVHAEFAQLPVLAKPYDPAHLVALLARIAPRSAG